MDGRCLATNSLFDGILSHENLTLTKAKNWFARANLKVFGRNKKIFFERINRFVIMKRYPAHLPWVGEVWILCRHNCRGRLSPGGSFFGRAYLSLWVWAPWVGRPRLTSGWAPTWPSTAFLRLLMLFLGLSSGPTGLVLFASLRKTVVWSMYKYSSPWI